MFLRDCDETPPKASVSNDRVHESRAISNNDDRDLQSFALQDLNLAISPGDKIAICGRSGSGKSSIILLLLGLLDPIPCCANNVSIDDMSLSQVDRTFLRERVLTIPQDVVFLPDGTSFQQNLDPFGVSSPEACRAVLATVGLCGLIEAHGGLAAGLESDMLSQGQKQLFSLARALLRHRKRAAATVEAAATAASVPHEDDHGVAAEAQQRGGLLLLDEFSSGVDHNTDREMQKIIWDEFADYTVVMVSHRLEMFVDLDQVIMMEAGRIVEMGRPRTLIETEGSKFRDLWIVG